MTSGKSKRIIVDHYPFSIDIFRLETDKTWTLEVVDHTGTSHVWEEQFASFEYENPLRWQVTPKNLNTIIEELRPNLGLKSDR